MANVVQKEYKEIRLPSLSFPPFNVASSKCIKKFNEARCERIAKRRCAISMSSYLNCPVRTDDVCIKRLFIAETHHGLIRHGLASLGMLENLYFYFHLFDECDYYCFMCFRLWEVFFRNNSLMEKSQVFTFVETYTFRLSGYQYQMKVISSKLNFFSWKLFTLQCFLSISNASYFKELKLVCFQMWIIRTGMMLILMNSQLYAYYCIEFTLVCFLLSRIPTFMLPTVNNSNLYASYCKEFKLVCFHFYRIQTWIL